MASSLKVLVAMLILPLMSCWAFGAKKITINVLPETAKIYVDGAMVANGQYTVKFDRKTDFYIIKVEAPGYITRTYRLNKNNPKNTVLYTLPEDEAEMASSGGADDGGLGLAGRWFDVTCRKGLSEDVVWKRLMNIATQYFENVEVRDKAAGWIKTGWSTTKFTNQTVRTRMEVRISFTEENDLTYRVRISSEIKDNDCRGSQCYMRYDRVLHRFDPLIQELQTSVGGGE